jgi:medium-chain acyl-[acyl-carrier-protein] hydrolase
MTTRTSELVPESRYLWRARRSGADRRLICFPHAGAGAAAYADWADRLPSSVELVAVQLPGRQNRIVEDPFTEVAPLIDALVQALRPVSDLPFAFFGHSCGAQCAHELAKALRAQGRRGPEHLFLSAQPAPGNAGVPQLHQLDDEDFRDAVVRLGGIDPEIAADEYVMESLQPLLRADFTLWERHRPVPAAPLDCPITVLCGDADPRVPVASTDGWRGETTAGCTVEVLPGDHFYFLEPQSAVTRLIGTTMTEGALR